MTRERITVKRPDITPLPSLAIEYEARIETVTDGNIVIVEAPLGRHFSNEELWETISDDVHQLAYEDASKPGLREKVKEVLDIEGQIKRRGISDRYTIFPPGVEKPDQETVVEVASSIGAHLLDRAISEQGWDPQEIRAVINTSAVLPTEVAQGLLERSSFNFNDDLIVRSHRTACAGVATALIDCLTHPDIKAGKVVIVPTELLSHKYDTNHAYYNPQILKIFGDNFGAIALDTSELELISARVDVIPGGGIELATDYDFGMTDEIPDYFHFPTGDRTRLIFNESGVATIMDQPPTGSNATMDGIVTAEFFSEHTPDTLLDVAVEALTKMGVLQEITIEGKSSYEVVPGMEQEFDKVAVISHDPSRFTSIAIDRRTRKKANERGIPRSHRPKIVPQHQEMRRSNSSSATTLSKWVYMLKTGELEGKPTRIVISPGIGATIACGAFTIKPHT